MNFTAREISYQQTGYFSKIITEYLHGNEFLKSFYKHQVSYEGIEASILDRENFPTDRNLLVQVLNDQYAGIPLAEAVLNNLKKLSDKNTFTITTAHQPAILTGNLYFIYKIVHVIKLAATLSERYRDKKFIPVFFMGSEDADLEELGHLFLNKEKVVWDTKQKGAVGRMKTAGLEKLIDRIEGEFAGYAHGAELVQLLKDCYQDSENIQQATLRLIHHLFGSYGLIVLIPDNRLLKSSLRGIFRDDLTNHTPYLITEENSNRLSENFSVQAKPREINVFYLRDDIRERIERKDGRYSVLNTPIYFSAEDMEKELANHPERFSPNVILRGLFQATILPDVAFVGGGGELAYWLEFKSLFKHYRVPFPVLILRNSFLLVKNNWRLKIEKAALSAEDFFKPEDRLIETFIRNHSTKQLNLDGQLDEMRSFYERIKEISGAADKTLEQHVDKLYAQSLQKLEELEKKILRAEKKNHEEIIRKIREIREVLFPFENLQERIENFIPWYAEYGKQFINLLYQHSLGLEQQFVILEENK
jgi:bacillithiol synthase